MGPTTSEDDWEWVFSPRAEDQLAQLHADTQERIIAKLDDVVSSEWREPVDFLEPLTNSPYKKLRVGTYRLGCRLRSEELYNSLHVGPGRSESTPVQTVFPAFARQSGRVDQSTSSKQEAPQIDRRVRSRLYPR